FRSEQGEFHANRQTPAGAGPGGNAGHRAERLPAPGSPLDQDRLRPAGAAGRALRHGARSRHQRGAVAGDRRKLRSWPSPGPGPRSDRNLMRMAARHGKVVSQGHQIDPASWLDSFRCLPRYLAALALGAGLAFAGPGATGADGGILFSCSPARLTAIKSDMAAYLAEQGIAPALVTSKRKLLAGSLRYTLRRSLDDGDT